MDSDVTKSNTATLTVKPTAATAVAVTPATATITYGATQAYTATPTGGSGTAHYQWYLDGTKVGTDSNSYTTSGTLASGAHEIYCDVYFTQNSVDSDVTKSNTATLTVKPAVTVATTPSPATVNFGVSASLTATATGGTGTISYQWFMVGDATVLGTAQTYATPVTLAVGSHHYYCVVTYTDNSVVGPAGQSADVTVTVKPLAPTVTGPEDLVINAGDTTATLSVTASVSDGGTLSYQWYRNSTASTTGSTKLSATTSTLQPDSTLADMTYYYCVVTNTPSAESGQAAISTTSGFALVDINALPPTIDDQPDDASITVGTTTTLVVGATVARGTLSYQWYSNTTRSNTGGTLITGATSTTYTTPASLEVGTYYYYCIVTNTAFLTNGSVTNQTISDAVSVVVIALVDADTPVIASEPADKTVNYGDTAALVVEASVSDAGILSYQWYSNTSASTSGASSISGATGSTYNAPTGTVGTMYYYCIVTNTLNSATGNKTATATSRIAKVVVNKLINAASPAINTQPVDVNVEAGTTVTLSLDAQVTDAGAMSYQWYSNTKNSNTGGTLISGATSNSYSPSTSSVATTYYYCIVTNYLESATGEQYASTASRPVKVQVTTLLYTITFNSQGGTTVVAQDLEPGVKVTKPNDPSLDGSIFVGWYTSTAFTTPWDFDVDTVAKDTTLYARFLTSPILGFTAVAETYTSIRISWKAGTGVTKYQVWRSTTSDGTYTRVKSTTDTYWIDTGKSTGVRYYYKVRAYATHDVSAGSTTVISEFSSAYSARALPASPDFTAKSASYSSVKLSWAAVAGATGYKIYRATAIGGTYSLLKTTTATSYTNTGLTTGKTYYYRMRAYRTTSKETFYSNYSLEKSVQVVPSKPGSFAVTASSSSKIKITWASVSGATGYQIWRSDSLEGTYTKVVTVKSPTKSYTNTGLESGKTYYYKMRSYRTVSGKNYFSAYTAIKNATTS